MNGLIRIPAALFGILLFIGQFIQSVHGETASSIFEVLDYHTTVEPRENGDTRITEKITVSVKEGQTLNGIHRNIVALKKGANGLEPAPLRIEAVYVNGQAGPTDKVSSRKALHTVYLCSDKKLGAGRHLFTLNYTVGGLFRTLKNGEGIIWTAVDRGWKGGVKKATAVFYPKPGCELSAQEGSIRGDSGAKASVKGRVETMDARGRKALVFDVPGPLEERDAFICLAGWRPTTNAPSPTPAPVAEPAPQPVTHQPTVQAPVKNLVPPLPTPREFVPGRPGPFKVVDYVSTVEIERNADILVTEEITIYLPTGQTNKGIIRDIPNKPRWKDRLRQNVKIEVESIAIDGKPCRVDDIDATTPGLYSIYMRDQAAYLTAGYHKFNIRFRMSEQLGFYENRDELTWNAVGRGWKHGVERAEAVVIPPQGVRFTQHRAWLGAKGSKDSPVHVEKRLINGREAYVFKPTRPIEKGEDFTYAVAWPKGSVTAAATVNPREEVLFTVLYALCFIGTLYAAWHYWNRYGKDPVEPPVIPLFYPPKKPAHLRKANAKRQAKNRLVHSGDYLSPAAVHYIHAQGELKARGMAALLLSLAMRGDCELNGNDKKGFSIIKKGVSSPAVEEYEAAKALPQSCAINNKGGTNNPLGAAYKACKNILHSHYDVTPQCEILIQPIILLVSLVLVTGIVCVQLWGEFSDMVVGELFVLVGGVTLLIVGALGMYFIVRTSIKESSICIALLSLLALLIFAMGFLLCYCADVLWILSLEQLICINLAPLFPIFFAFLMDAPTKEQVELKQQVKGLALYIGTAETNRFNFANPPEENLELYHRLLPYAVALDLEDAWGARFADKLKNALYSEGSTEMVYSTLLAHRLVDDTDRSLTSYRDAVRAESARLAKEYSSSSDGGSSFSGSGGGAGSGGGGGGGRAC